MAGGVPGDEELGNPPPSSGKSGIPKDCVFSPAPPCGSQLGASQPLICAQFHGRGPRTNVPESTEEPPRSWALPAKLGTIVRYRATRGRGAYDQVLARLSSQADFSRGVRRETS